MIFLFEFKQNLLKMPLKLIKIIFSKNQLINSYKNFILTINFKLLVVIKTVNKIKENCKRY